MAPDAPPEGDGDAVLSPSGAWSRRAISPDDLLASLPGALRRRTRSRGDRRRGASWSLASTGRRRGRPTGRRAAGPPGAGGGARAVIDALPERIVNDPLGAVDELTRIESTLAEVAGARAELARLGEATAAAARTLAELEGLMDEGRAAFDRSRPRSPAEGLLAPVDPDVLSRGPGCARGWRLERLVSEGDVSRAGAGLDRWRSLAEQTVAVARQVAEANALPWRRRRAAGAAAGDPGQRRGGGSRRGPDGVRAGGAGGTVTGRPVRPRPRSPPSRPCWRACASRSRRARPTARCGRSRSCPRASARRGGRLGCGPTGGGAGMTDGSPCALAGCGGSLDGGYCDTCGRLPAARPWSAARRPSLAGLPPAGRRPASRPSPVLRRAPPLAPVRRRAAPSAADSSSGSGSGAGGRYYARPRLRPHRCAPTRPAGGRAPAGAPPRWSAAGPGAHGWGSASSTSPPSPRAIPWRRSCRSPRFPRTGASAPSAAARSGAPATTGRDCRRDSAASAGPGSPSRLGSERVTWSAASTRCSAPLPTAAGMDLPGA